MFLPSFLSLAAPFLIVNACAQGQDDPLPPGAIWRQGSTRLYHPGGINSLAYSPDGKLLASGGFDGAIRLWDAAMGKQVASFYANAHEWRVYRVKFAPDGKTLAAGTGAGIVLYDVAARRMLRLFKGEALDVSFSPDGRLIAGSDSRVSLWDVATGKALQQTPSDSRAIYGLTFTPDGKSFLYSYTSANGETDLLRWDIAAKETRRLPGPKGWIHAMSFARDGTTVAAASHSEVLLVDAATYAPRFRLKTHAWDLAFCPKTQRIAVATDADIALYNTTTGKIEQTLAKQPADVKRRVAVAPDGLTLATSGSDGRIRLWDVASGKEKLPQADVLDAVTGLAFSAHSRALAVAGRDGRVQLFDATTGAPGKALAARDERIDWFERSAQSLVFAHDGRTLVGTDQSRRIRVWDAVLGNALRHWQLERPVQLALSRDGKTLAASGDSLKFWDVAQGKVIRDLDYAGKRGKFALAFGRPAFSPDDKVVAAVVSPYEPVTGSDKILLSEREPVPPASVQMWEAASGKPVAGDGLLDPRLRGARQTLFLDDGTLVTSGEPMLLWDRRVGAREFVHPPDSRSGVMARSPDGRWLAASCVFYGKAGTAEAQQHVVCVWETASGTIAWRRAVHRGTIAALAFTPDGRRLATGSADATLILWDFVPDVPRPPQVWAPKDSDALWHALADPDAAIAYGAMHILPERPEQALALLGDKLRADPPLPIGQWLDALQADEFAVRDKAQQALLTLGPEAVPHAFNLDASKLTVEGQRRRQTLLRRLAARWFAPEQLRQIRAVAVLERIATPQARRLLDVLAEGRRGSPLSEHARAARGRLGS